MEISDAIATEEMKTKLENLINHMPGEYKFTYDFGAYLAGRLNPELTPMGFNITFRLTLRDLKNGIVGYSGEPVPPHLGGMLPSVYANMGANIPRIARAVCPSDFADKVCQVYAEMFMLKYTNQN